MQAGCRLRRFRDVCAAAKATCFGLPPRRPPQLPPRPMALLPLPPCPSAGTEELLVSCFPLRGSAFHLAGAPAAGVFLNVCVSVCMRECVHISGCTSAGMSVCLVSMLVSVCIWLCVWLCVCMYPGYGSLNLGVIFLFKYNGPVVPTVTFAAHFSPRILFLTVPLLGFCSNRIQPALRKGEQGLTLVSGSLRPCGVEILKSAPNHCSYGVMDCDLFTPTSMTDQNKSSVKLHRDAQDRGQMPALKSFLPESKQLEFSRVSDEKSIALGFGPSPGVRRVCCFTHLSQLLETILKSLPPDGSHFGSHSGISFI